MKFEQFGAAIMYQADARDVVGEHGGAAVVCSDPPYRLTSGGKNEGGPSGGWMSDYANDGAPVVCDITWPEILRVVAASMADDADAYVFANDKNVRAMLNAAADAGLGFHNLLIWDKRTATANRWYMKNAEFVGYFWKGKARTINDPSAKQLLFAPQVDETKHPTEKPVALCRHYIENSSVPGDLVVDLFAGTATTGVAALQSGRRFVGAEVDPRWFDVACQRLERAAQLGPTALRGAAVPKLSQASLL